MNKKIVSIDDLSRISRLGKSKGKKVVHCHGVFDLLHIGHIKHFQEAKALGDLLIVTITPDKYVKKGPNRPAFTTILRLEAIAALESVDFVAENKWPTAVESILLVKPSIYFKGPDYKDSDSDITGMIKEEAKAISSVKGKIKYSTDITFSSSSLLNKYGDIYTNDQKVLDQVASDLRRARAAAMNIIPTSTGAAKAVGLVLPHLNGKIHGMAYRVPTSTVSVTDFTVVLNKSASVDEINGAYIKSSESNLNGILQYTDEPLVSSDFKQNTHSTIIDGLSTMSMDGNLVKVVGWYDNEWGYSCRTADLANYISSRGF